MDEPKMTRNEAPKPRFVQPTVDYSPEATSRIVRNETSTPFSTPVQSRPSEPVTPGVGLVIGTTPDPVSLLNFRLRITKTAIQESLNSSTVQSLNSLLFC